MKLGIQGTGLTGLGLSEVKSQSDIQKKIMKNIILSERIFLPMLHAGQRFSLLHNYITHSPLSLNMLQMLV
jgi:hypothetical protein